MTADRSAAADTLRDELANSLRRAMYDLPMDELAADEQRAILDLADALLPDWLAYADAQEAAVRERIAAAIEADGLHFPPNRKGDPAWLAARIAREQP